MDINLLIEIGPVKTSLVEIIAVVFGLASVWSMKKESILAFPFGIINVLGYVYISFTKELYALSGINLFFAFMSVYGWYNWTHHGEDQKKVVISKCSGKEILINTIALLVFFLFIRWLLIKYTDSPVPTWDSVTTSLYIVAMWLLARKKIENWIAWIIGDIISIFLYAIPYANNEPNYFSSIQFLIFTIIAVFGFIEWRNKLIQTNNLIQHPASRP
jgi:nicotinamide mononucleotide transporter